jgi:hypothetical protein
LRKRHMALVEQNLLSLIELGLVLVNNNACVIFLDSLAC